MKRLVFFFFLIVCIICWGFDLPAQNPVPASALTSQDRKDLEKITNQLHRADMVKKRAKEMEVHIDKKKRQEGLSDDVQEIIELQSNAINKRIQALENRAEANSIKYQLYKRHLKKFEKDSASGEMNMIKAKLLVDDAEQFFYRTSDLRAEATDETPDLQKKLEKLQKALNIEKLGLQKIEKALEYYYQGSQESEISDQSQESKASLPTISSDKVLVNRALLLNIQQTLLKLDDDSFLADLQHVKKRDTLSGQRLVHLWYAYLYPDRQVNVKQEKENQEVSKNSDLYADSNKSPEQEDVASKTEEGTDKRSAIASGEKKDQPELSSEEKKKAQVRIEEQQNEKEQKEPEIKKSEFRAGKIFRVQIAAEKKPLAQSVLRKLYDGDKEISRVVEDGWYKYSIGDFATFSSAEAFKKELSTEHAFVVAYEDGSQVSIDKNMKDAKLDQEPETEVKTIASHSEANKVEFKVQIAASRRPMKESVLQSVYSGNLPIDQHRVNGWYKYAVGSFSDYQQARTYRNGLNVKGAFITAYQGNRFLNIRKALQSGREKPAYASSGTTETKNLEGVTFKVQVAADRVALNKEKLKTIYSGPKEVRLNKEDGWYRYSIGSCPTFFHAQRLKSNTNVRGAFVVAYKNGKRINAYKLRLDRMQCPGLSVKTYTGDGGEVSFSVQIIASQRQLKTYDLQFVYCGNQPIYEHHTGKWYKYAVGKFRSYQKAVDLKRTICVPGAFVVAHKNNKQLDIKQAINQYSQ